MATGMGANMLGRREIYYVSHLSTGMVSIIDGNRFEIIKEIEVGSRPLSIVPDERNNVYVASDRTGQITLINGLHKIDREWHIPNNGNIQISWTGKRLYVCNADKVCVYDLESGEEIACIAEFAAANCIRLDKNGERLFVLDVLKNELKIYDALELDLISQFRNVGQNPRCMEMGYDERQVYIGNRGVHLDTDAGNISILELESGNIFYMDFPAGSSITDLGMCEKLLFAVNTGLGQVDVIDVSTRERVACIRPSLPEPQRLCVFSPLKMLLVTSCDMSSGMGAVDRIDISRIKVTDTLYFTRKYSIPYAIGVVCVPEDTSIADETTALRLWSGTMKDKGGTAVLAKKILSAYQEKIFFKDVSVQLPSMDEKQDNASENAPEPHRGDADGRGAINVFFYQCEIIGDSMRKTILEGKRNYILLEYDFRIPYTVEIGRKCIVRDGLRGRQKAVLYIPDSVDINDVQFSIVSLTRVVVNPVVSNGVIRFSASSLILTRAFVEEIFSVPDCSNCKSNPVRVFP